MSKNRYPKSFKLEAVKRVLQGESVAKLAVELGVNSNSLYNWVSQYRGEVLPTLQGLSAEQELIELRKENARLKEEREILKKAATYFAKHQR
jgi:transposase